MAKSTNENIEIITPEQFISQPISNNKKTLTSSNGDEFVSCLKNERVVIKHATRPNKNISDPKHELYGGMANGANRIFTVQMLRNGQLTNPLNDSEKLFLENYMGLEPNALSIYLKKDNF